MHEVGSGLAALEVEGHRADVFLNRPEKRNATTAAVMRDLAAAPYDDPERRWNWVVGDVAADLDDCTDSRDYRLAGFGEVGATG